MLLQLKRADLGAELLGCVGGLVRSDPEKNAKKGGTDQKDDESELFERRCGSSGRLSTALRLRGIYQRDSYCRAFGNIDALRIVLRFDGQLSFDRGQDGGIRIFEV